MSNDKILHVYGPDYNWQTLDESTESAGTTNGNTRDWQDTLKYTNGIKGFIHNLHHVHGGTEDCADFNNRASDVRVEAAGWSAWGKYLATVKGGCRNITLIGDVWRHGSEVDVDLGNWSDQSQLKTTGVVLALTSNSKTPVTVRVLNADKPILVTGSGPYRYVFPHPDAWYHGICVKFFMVFHNFFK